MHRPEHPWPTHSTTTLPWRSATRGPRPDRETTSLTASVPPRIAHASWSPDPDTEALLHRASAALRTLDAHHGDELTALGGLLARTDAVASSRIEEEPASLDDVARAVVGVRANTSATVVVRAGRAIDRLVASADAGAITEAAVLDAHRRLMGDDPVDGRYAGRWREVQNWIGGGSTPRTARHVPPPPALVPELMDDLFAFLGRDDLHPIAQAAIAHAQFESIHPFTDGNGRIGRALIAAVLRRRGLTRVVTVPIATALVAERDRYFWHLDRFRRGCVDEWIRDLAIAIGTVCDEATLTALHLAEIEADLTAAARGLDLDLRGRHGSRNGPHGVVVGALLDDPVLTDDHLDDLLGREDAVIERVVSGLGRVGVIRPVTERRRRRAWVGAAPARELTALGDRVRAAVTQRANRVGW